jgi:hypothetical protein
VKPETDQRLSDHISLGVVTRVFPPHAVDRVLAECGRVERRHRLLPARAVVYYVMGLALFSTSSYEEVMRMLVAGHSWSGGWAQPWTVPSRVALSKARARLGSEPLQMLFDRVAVPMATEATRGAFYRSWRVMSIDGTCLDLADTPDNVEVFGRPPSSRGVGIGGFPQVRVLGLAEAGTHAIIDAAVGSIRVGEQTMAVQVLRSLRAEMLLLADRGFLSYQLWVKAAGTGADLLWRVRSHVLLPAQERYGDGSYISTMYPSTKARRNDVDPVPVRVIEYTISDQSEASLSYRLVTTILDPDQAPAAELAALYSQRWEIESAFDELKTHQRSPRLVLRSKTPDGVRQEVYGHLCVHYAIRWLMHDTAQGEDTDPDRVSFTRALRAARRTTVTHPGFSPQSHG